MCPHTTALRQMCPHTPIYEGGGRGGVRAHRANSCIYIYITPEFARPPGRSSRASSRARYMSSSCTTTCVSPYYCYYYICALILLTIHQGEDGGEERAPFFFKWSMRTHMCCAYVVRQKKNTCSMKAVAKRARACFFFCVLHMCPHTTNYDICVLILLLLHVSSCYSHYYCYIFFSCYCASRWRR